MAELLGVPSSGYDKSGVPVGAVTACISAPCGGPCSVARARRRVHRVVEPARHRSERFDPPIKRQTNAAALSLHLRRRRSRCLRQNDNAQVILTLSSLFPSETTSRSPDIPGRFTISQWHPTRNGSVKLAQVSPQSRRLTWWRNPRCGHEWQATPRERDKYQRLRCPECEMVLDSLGYLYPELATEWAPENSTTLACAANCCNMGSAAHVDMPEKPGASMAGLPSIASARIDPSRLPRGRQVESRTSSYESSAECIW